MVSFETHQRFKVQFLNELPVYFNEDFEDICDWFVDNKLSIHFEDDKTKSIIFISKRKTRNINIRYKEMNLKKQAQVTYLGCVLDKSMSG